MPKAMAESVPLLISVKNMMIFDEFFENTSTALIPLEFPGHSSHRNCQNQLIEPPTVEHQRIGDTGKNIKVGHFFFNSKAAAKFQIFKCSLGNYKVCQNTREEIKE